MGKIKKWHGVNFTTKKPPKGCQLCSKGAKVVIFVTGECFSNCYYCPVSTYRRKDIIFADEQQVETLSDIIHEAKMISALGAGITGGEPTIHLNRVLTIIKLLKEEFGRNFHCHLYTSAPLRPHELLELYNVELDEIRFHPPMLKLTDKLQESILYATMLNWSVGIEVPGIPNKEKELREIIDFAIAVGLEFVNINEFEFTEANISALRERGFQTKDSTGAAVKGSEKLSIKILNDYRNSPIRLHYCSSRYKDRIQLRNRLKRRVKNYARDFDIITNEGLIRRGIIRVKKSHLVDTVKSLLEERYNIKSYMLEIDKKGTSILTAEYIVRKLAKDIKEAHSDKISSIEVVEQYPFDDGIITYLEPLTE